jgi:benzil reductase ((S)-benzoin forming)
MKTLIITGASKGLGKAIAKLYLQKNYQVISLSRSQSEDLKGIEQIPCDLSKIDEAELIFKNILKEVINSNPESITLINNAGSLGEIHTLEEISIESIKDTVTINYTAPLLLSSIFIKETEGLAISKKIRTISSGAANGAYHGWSVYCSTKSAVDSFTKVIGVEQVTADNPIHSISIYPGVIDTGMQKQIRNSSEKAFSNVERFKAMKENNELASPESVAELIYKIDNDLSIGNGEIVDVRN